MGIQSLFKGKLLLGGIVMSLLVNSLAGIAPSWSAVYHVAQRHPAASDDNPGDEAHPWKTISKAAATVVAGDTVLVHEGIYRESVVPKNSGESADKMITYSGAPGEEVIIKGSVVMTGWQKQGGLWTAPWPHPEERFKGYRDSFRYRYEQVFWNGHLLFHAPAREFLEVFTREPEPLAKLLQTESEAMCLRRDNDLAELVAVVGTFYADGAFWVDYEAKRIYLKLPDRADPNSDVTEVSVESRLFGGRDIEFICLRNLTLLHCAQQHFQRGVIVADRGWVLEDLDVGYSAGRGVTISGAEAVRRVKAHHHGALGFGGSARLIEDCETSDNNYKGGGWLTDENGGWKAVFANGMTIRRHIASRNFGPGIWLDIDNRNSTITQCRAQDNTGSGIFIEISGMGGITITDNLCTGNGLASFSSWGAAGIKLGESESCTVEHNVCVGNKEGIAFRMQGPREFGGRPPASGSERPRVSYYTHDHIVRHNILAFNRDWQLVFWGDNPFFGPHPSPRVNEEEKTGKPLLDPEKLNLTIDHNLYFAEPEQGLICYGPTWRPKHEKFKSLAEWQKAHLFDANSQFADPQFVDWQNDDFRLRPASPARKAGIGLQRPAMGMTDTRAD